METTKKPVKACPAELRERAARMVTEDASHTMDTSKNPCIPSPLMIH